MSMTFCVTSCSNNQKGNVEANDSTVVDTTIVDSLDSLVDTICID